MDIDHVVPLRRPDLRQETRLEDVANEGLASRTMTAFSDASGGAGRGARLDGIHCFFRAIP
jgi:hypothetical protein